MDAAPHPDPPADTVTEPAKLLRVIGMTQRILDELRHDGVGDAARTRVTAAYEDSLHELRDVLSDTLRRELDRLTAPVHDAEALSEPELRVAEAQLTGWLEGLMHGLQASAMSQQAAQQLAQAQSARHPQEGPQAADQGGYW